MCKLHDEDLAGQALNSPHMPNIVLPSVPTDYIRQQQLENLSRLKRHDWNGDIDAKVNQIAEKILDKWLKELESE